MKLAGFVSRRHLRSNCERMGRVMPQCNGVGASIFFQFVSNYQKCWQKLKQFGQRSFDIF